MRMDRRGGAWVVGLWLLCASCVSPKEFTPQAPSVPQLRLPRNDVYEGSVITGALRPTFVWEESTNASGDPLRYELQYGSDSTFASDTTTIETNEPTFRPGENLLVSTVPPVGRRYYWRVRACLPQICSDYSPTWWVNLGRSAKDFNGDGYADVAVGAPEYQSRGAVFVYFGSSGGLDTVPDGVIGQSGGGDNFGGYIAPAGDFNADGYADLIVGAYQYQPSGRAYIFFGGPGNSMDRNADVILEGRSPNEGFGKSVSSAGDLNGDGFSDVVVGAFFNSGNGSQAGRAYIYFGGVLGTPDLPDGVLSGKMAGENFGYRVSSAGDLDGDGFSDLAITSGDYLEVLQMPCFAQIFQGTRDSVKESPALRLEGKSADGCAVLAVDGQDINRDGFADLIVATSPSFPARPFVTIHLGSSEISTPSEFEISASVVGNRFIGSVASAGDVNADGLADILIGGSDGNSQPRVLVFLGSGPSSYISSQPAASITGTANTFGMALGSPGDINGDGFDDIVIGAYSEGAAYVFFGNAGGTLEPTADAILAPNFQNSLYGFAVL